MEGIAAVAVLALAASFLPLQFGAETSLLAKNDGVKKATGLALGVVLFRVVVAILFVVVFEGATAVFTEGIQNVFDFIGSTLKQLGMAATSGQHVVFDILLILAGIALIVHVYRSLRDYSKVNETSKEDEKKAHELGAIEMILFGIVWTATGPNQWLFTVTGIGQILAIPVSTTGRLIAFILFLLLSSLMIALPILLIILRPKSADADLQKISKWVNGTLRYVVLAGLAVIGLFLIIRGAGGLVQFFNP